MKFKRSMCFLLTMLMLLPLMPPGLARANETAPESTGSDEHSEFVVMENVAENSNAACGQCGLPISGGNDAMAVSAPLQTNPIEPMGVQPGEMETPVLSAPFANSDLEANTDLWTFRVNGDDTGKLTRETLDFEDQLEITDYPVKQICILGNSLYALFARDGSQVVSEMDLDSMQWEDMFTVETEILRFAVTEDTLYYLTEDTITAYTRSENIHTAVFSTEGLSRFWLRTETILEYMTGDESVIQQYDLQTGEITSYANQISALEEWDPNAIGVNGLGISGLRAKFPAGKYWNHAGNPGSSNSVNNQNGYTSTPCSKHGGYIGTSQQTCNGFQPGSTQLSWQCMGYAEKLGYDATGYNPRNNANGWYTNSSSSALDNLKAGDIVRYKNDRHSIYVIGVNGDTVTYTDCNSNGHCIIRWDATISKSTLSSTLSYVRSAPGGLSPEPEVCNCSTSYSGYYTCTTSGGSLNMRSGHGTGYGVVTGIPSGATVYVSKANGSWAHVEYNGYTGYASMQYLQKQGTSTERNNRISVWLSHTELGEGISTVRTGEWLFLNYKLYDANSGDLFDTYNTHGYSVTLKFYDPSGAVTYSGVAHNDSNYIGIKRTQPGTYRGEVIFAFNSGGTTTLDVSINMVYEPRVTATSTALSLSMTGISRETVTISYSGATQSDTVSVSRSISGDCITASWGEWSNSTIPLTISGTKAGTGKVTVYLKDYDTGEVLASTVIHVYVEAPSYTVSYHANGGTGAPASQTKEYGTDLTLSTDVPTRFGYNFKGWGASSSATSPAYYSGDTYTANSSVTLYAVWAEPGEMSGAYSGFTRTATINNGGAGVYYKFIPNATTNYRIFGTGEVDTVAYLYDASGSQLAANDDGGSNRQFLLEYSFTGNSTYYIYVKFFSSSQTGALPFQVEKRYSISYNANGGSGAPATQYKYGDETITLSTTVPTWSGHTFQGWATSSSATTAEYQPGGSYSRNKNVTLYAVWDTSSYTISYNANGGSGAPSSQTKTAGSALTLSTTVPTRMGYTFLGWSTSSTASSAAYMPGGSFTTDADTTLYAVWKTASTISSSVTNSSYSTAISFADGYWYFSITPSFSGKLRFESTGSLDTRIYLYDASGTQLDWDDDDGDGNNFQLTYSVTSGTKYYVKVKMYGSGTGTIQFSVKRVYDVTYNANGGSGAPAAQIKVYGTALTLSSTIPTRSGYTFQGWGTSGNAASASYQPGSSFKGNSNLTLYAVWTANCDNGHSYAYKVTKTPTTSATGTITGTCSRCSGTTTVTLPKLNSTDYRRETITANTCTTDGLERYTWKTTTYGSFSFDVTLPATGHHYVEGICVYCGAKDPNGGSAVVASGTCGDHITWVLTADGTLTLSGYGEMDETWSFLHHSWYPYEEDILRIVIEEGITNVGICAFIECSNVTEVSIPDTVEVIDIDAFHGCTSLQKITIPAGVKEMGSAPFYCYQGSSLKIIYFEGDAPTFADDTFQTVTATAYYPEGNKTWTADVLQNYGGNIIWVPYDKIEEEYITQWISATTSLNGTIDLNIYVALSDNILNDPNAYVRFIRNGEIVDVPVSKGIEAEKRGQVCYRYSCEIFAKQVADTVTIQVMNSKGAISDALEYSVMRYCVNQIKNSKDAELVKLCKALLNYATAAQVYFNHNTNNLANASLSEADKALPGVDASAYKFNVVGAEPGIKPRSATLMLEAEVAIRVYFIVEEGYDISEFTFTIDGVEVPVQQNEKGYYIESNGIPAKELDNMHKFTVGGLTVNYGALSYVNSKAGGSNVNEANLAKALYAYYTAAEVLLG